MYVWCPAAVRMRKLAMLVNMAGVSMGVYIIRLHCWFLQMLTCKCGLHNTNFLLLFKVYVWVTLKVPPVS